MSASANTAAAPATSIESWATRQALEPIAEAVGHPELVDDAPKLAIVVGFMHDRLCAAEESREMLKTKLVPALEGRIRELTLDRNAWCDRATAAERRNTALLGYLLFAAVAVGAGVVMLIGATIT